MLSAAECEINGSGIGFRSDDEIKLQLTLLAVISEVNSGINIFISDAGILWNVALPLFRSISDVVVGPAGQLIYRRNLGGRVFPHNLHANHGVRLFLCDSRIVAN